MSITASMLYDLLASPHRVSMDLFANPAEQDEVSPFIRMLWEKGATHEQDIGGRIGIPVLDLSGYRGDENERLTAEEMDRQEPFIYSGKIIANNLVGGLICCDGLAIRQFTKGFWITIKMTVLPHEFCWMGLECLVNERCEMTRR